MMEKKKGRILERRDGIGKEVDPSDFSRSRFFRVIVRESVRNGTCPVI